MWWKDNKLYDIQLVLTLGLTKTEVYLCPDKKDNRLRFNPLIQALQMLDILERSNTYPNTRIIEPL
jgi:hypothetical protein